MADDTLRKAAEMLRAVKEGQQSSKAQIEKERRDLILGVGKEISDSIKPMLSELVAQGKTTREDMLDAVSQIKIDVTTPDVNIPDIKVPEPRVSVTVPPIRVPDVIMPDEMNVKGWVSLMGVDLNNPLPVQLRDAKGNPLNLFENLTTLISGGNGGGGKHDFFTIKGFSSSAYADYVNSDNRLRVSVETGGSGLTDSELRAAHLDVQQVSGAIDSVYITGASGTLAANIVDSSGVAYSGSNPVPVVFGASATQAVNLVDSTGVVYSGSNPVPIVGPVVVSSITATTAANIVDSTGVAYSGSNPLPITGPIVVSSVTASTQATIIDSSGVGYSGSNPVPVTLISGALTSTIVVGSVVSDVADDGSAPVKIGGIARTANPTAVANGDSISFSADTIGRQITRPVNARGLIATAYISLTTGTEATLLAASAATYLDLIYLMGTNNSDAAVTVDIRNVTAGNIQTSVRIPANGTAGISLPVPIPQEETGNTWTADLPDITGTTVTLSALFSKEL